MVLTWKTPLEIAQTLADTYPDLDPLTLSFVKFHELITSLPDFQDDPEASNEKILEGILTLWLEERD